MRSSCVRARERLNWFPVPIRLIVFGGTFAASAAANRQEICIFLLAPAADASAAARSNEAYTLSPEFCLVAERERERFALSSGDDFAADPERDNSMKRSNEACASRRRRRVGVASPRSLDRPTAS